MPPLPLDLAFQDLLLRMNALLDNWANLGPLVMGHASQSPRETEIIRKSRLYIDEMISFVR